MGGRAGGAAGEFNLKNGLVLLRAIRSLSRGLDHLGGITFGCAERIGFGCLLRLLHITFQAAQVPLRLAQLPTHPAGPYPGDQTTGDQADKDPGKDEAIKRRFDAYGHGIKGYGDAMAVGHGKSHEYQG